MQRANLHSMQINSIIRDREVEISMACNLLIVRGRVQIKRATCKVELESALPFYHPFEIKGERER